uniref:AAA family ATPase n=1 Tax=Acetatifactor sp. TaxID=1872090 RepID=UPI0040578DD2
MKIKKIHLEQFKRFTNLTIHSIPETAKLVVLLGPNGCGKSSVFDAFKTWHLRKGYSNVANNDYCKKISTDHRSSYDLVNIDFHTDISQFSQTKFHETFYFRTAYRNSPNISITSLNKLNSPLETVDNRMMIQNDATVNDNYQRLISETLSQFYNESNDGKTVKELRDETLSKIREPLRRLFPDLILTEIGLVTDKAEFYFSKGTTPRYGYEKLSGGEKAAFDLLLDMVIKSEFYKDTIFCIDEPETHIHTSLQARLLTELFQLVPNESQLWIATHSFGMLKEARKLLEQHPGEVVFLNFDGYDFDETVTLEPSSCDTSLWNKMVEITLDDYAPFLSPETIIFCEGTTRGRKRKDFDARCYSTIFKSTHPNTIFYSLGSCNDIESKQSVIDFITSVSPSSNIIRIVDRDDRSSEEIADLQADGIKVISRRHIESYILDDSVLKKWCQTANSPDKENDLLAIKAQKIADSVSRGNAPDDIKSAGNDICTLGKKLLGVTGCGNTGEMIMRDTLAKLITPDMLVFQELENDIFGS